MTGNRYEMKKKTTKSILISSETYRISIKEVEIHYVNIPDSKVHRANMGPIWGRQDPGGPRVGPMSFAIWDVI